MRNDILTTEIYPKLYERLPDAFPEFGFKLTGRGYQSTTDLKTTGETGKRGKVYVYANNISHLMDYTRGSRSLWDYLQERDNLTNKDTFRELARLAGHVLTNEHLSPEALVRIEEANRSAQLWEDVNSFFIECLSHKENSFARTPAAKMARDYLEKERGYSPGLFLLPGAEYDHRQPKIEVGFVPSLQALTDHLVNEVGHPELDVIGLLTDERIGKSHVLSIPYRDQSGRIKGFAFRPIVANDTKYLYSQGMEKSRILFNLRGGAGDQDLVIVESQFDALHAAALGITNICAIGGSTISREQIELAIKYGAKRLTFMLDNDDAGRNGTDKCLALLQPFQDKVRVYVAVFPDGIKDLDELLLVERGEEAFRQIKREAINGWLWQLQRIFDKYTKGVVTDKDITSLLHEVVGLASTLSKLDSDLLIKAFIDSDDVQQLGITTQSITDTVDQIRAAEAGRIQSEAIRTLLDDTGKKVRENELLEALDLLKTRTQEIREISKADAFGQLVRPIDEQEMAARLKLKSSDLRTGYIIEGEELVVPAGAISIVAAPTSHGKTTFMINLALRIIDHQPKKSVYLLSYEEDADSVTISAMNTYIAANLSANNRKSIRSYYRDDSVEYTRKEARPDFDEGRTKFFTELINSQRLNIHYVDYDSDILIDAIRYLYKHGNAGAVLVDYMQLLHKGQLGKNKYGNRQEEIKQICLDLKDVAVETGLPLILGAQFNREVVNPARLHYTKIREAADIEQIANLILGFWNNNMKMLAGEDETDGLLHYRSSPNTLYVEKLKHRTGVPGLAGMLNFDGNTGVIDNSVFAMNGRDVSVGKKIDF